MHFTLTQQPSMVNYSFNFSCKIHAANWCYTEKAMKAQKCKPKEEYKEQKLLWVGCRQGSRSWSRFTHSFMGLSSDGFSLTNSSGSLTSTVLCTSVAGRCSKWEFDDCPKCYDDRGVTQLQVDFLQRVWHCMWQQLAWSSSEQTSFQVHLDMSSYRPHHRPRPTVEESQLPGELLVG